MTSVREAPDHRRPSDAVLGRLPLLDRFLPAWIVAAMACGIGLGRLVPDLDSWMSKVKLAGTSLPIAAGLLVMMYPVLAKVRYGELGRVTSNRRLMGPSLLLNWVVGPALMFALAWLMLPDLAAYRTGLVIVGLARCIAMVLIWNDLAGGDREAAAILVALNSLFQIVAFAGLAYYDQWFERPWGSYAYAIEGAAIARGTGPQLAGRPFSRGAAIPPAEPGEDGPDDESGGEQHQQPHPGRVVHVKEEEVDADAAGVLQDEGQGEEAYHDPSREPRRRLPTLTRPGRLAEHASTVHLADRCHQGRRTPRRSQPPASLPWSGRLSRPQPPLGTDLCRRMTTDLDAGVLLTSAVESSGTSTLASGK